MIVERSFDMAEDVDAAQQRFRSELAPALYRMGFKVGAEEPGRIDLDVRYMGGWLFLGLVTSVVWALRKMLGHRIALTFEAAGAGTRVDIHARVPGGVGYMLGLLGRRGHWPANLEDPDWAPESGEDPYAEWDGADVNPGELDRTTRRALKKAGRL